MHISIHTIEGRKGSACLNQAFSVVAKDEKGTAHVLDILPADEVPAKAHPQLATIYADAVRQYGLAQTEKIKSYARPLLGIRPSI